MPLFGFGKKQQPESPEGRHGQNPQNPYLGLRTMALGLRADQIGAEPTPELPRVYGAVVDWPVGSGSATFVAMADGTASMYVSSGGGTIGAGANPAVAKAGRALLLAFERQLDVVQPPLGSTEIKEGVVTYYALTYEGLRLVSHPAGGPPRGDAALGELGNAFQDYVSAFRIEAAERRRGR